MIKIVGLGNGDINKLNINNIQELEKSSKVYINFNNEIIHNIIQIRDKIIQFTGAAENLSADSLAKKITDEALGKNQDLVYAALGNPISDDVLSMCLIKECKRKSIPYKVFPADSFLNNVIDKFENNLFDGVNIIKESNFCEHLLNKRQNTIITGISSYDSFKSLVNKLVKYYGAVTKVHYFRNNTHKEMFLKDLSFTFNGNFECIYIPKQTSTNDLGQNRDIYDLFELVDVLRGENGCPWDRVQTHKSIENSMIEESYEVVDAIEKGDIKSLEEELGDVLFQIVFHVSLEQNNNTFGFNDIVKGIYDKMVYRHPHVFGNITADNEDEVLRNWDSLKNKEKSLKTKTDEINAVAKYLPSLIRAEKVQKKVSKVGFDFKDVNEASKKVIEELYEVLDVYNNGNMERITEEIGDLLFSVVNVSRILKVDSEEALRKTIDKFISRFTFIESEINKSGRDFDNVSIDFMNTLWEKAKKIEK